MLEVEGISSGYGQIGIVRNCSFNVSRGEIVAILGHNGMGKTTLLRTIMGHLPTKQGRIRYDGEEITALAVHQRARRGLSIVPQGREIFPGLTVRDNIRMGLFKRKAHENETIEGLVNQMPRLRPLLDRVGGTLSGGEQQLLAVARCLATAPKLILLDEPTEGIQPSIKDELAEIFLGIRNRRTITVLLVEQNLDFVNALADRVLLIQKGHITQELDRVALNSADLISEFLGFGKAKSEADGLRGS